MKANADIQSHRFGVGYVPTRSWYYFWNDFSADSVAADLDAIASIGADHIRVFLMWPSFQPNPGHVSQAHLDRLETLVSLADERAIDVCLSLFNGWVSGYRYLPPFGDPRDFYSTDSNAQRIYVDEIARTVGNSNNLIGLDVGNEMNCCWGEGTDTEKGDRWLDMTISRMEERCPGVHSSGVDHKPWFTRDTFSAKFLARRQPIVPLHCWSFWTGALSRGGPFGPPALKLIPGMAALARSFAGDREKPIWAQEYGTSPEWTERKRIPDFLERATLAGIEGGVSWFTWWSSHDVDRRYEFESLEYELGLLTVDNKIKPQGHTFKEIAGHYRNRPVSLPDSEPPPPPDESRDMEATWRWLIDWIG